MSLSTSAIMAQLNTYTKTETGKKKLNNYIKSSAKDNSSKANINIQKYAQRMRDILREEISDIISTTTGDTFLDYINIDNSVSTTVLNGKEYISVGLSFNEQWVTRSSLYPQKYDPVYMPTIVNNSWESGDKPRDYVYGYDRHDNFTRSSKGWNYSEDKGFMKRAVDRFNAEMANNVIYAEYSSKYDGGTL